MLEILGEAPQSDGLHVYFNSSSSANGIPFAYPYRASHYTIVFVVSGNLTVQLNLIPYELRDGDALVITPKTVMHILKMDGDFQLIVINFTLDFALQHTINRNEVNSFDFYASNMIQKLSLNAAEMEQFVMYSNLLMEKNTNKNPALFGDEIVSLVFNLLLYELAVVYKNSNADVRIDLSRKEELTFRFLKILEQNFRKERSVQFYANSLFVTRGHLSKVLKEISGKTAGQLIDDAIIMEARLLLSDPSSSIAQIADELQFGDQSLFGRFFKKNTGFSPSEYRNKRPSL